MRMPVGVFVTFLVMATACGCVLAAVLCPWPAHAADTAPTTGVGTTAAAWTPQVTSPDATVRQLAKCGPTMYAVGAFSRVTQGGKTYTRNNAFSFSATTGALTGWNPNVNGEVNSIALSPNCATAYLGGTFTAVRAAKAHNLAAVRSATGALRPRFQHSTDGAVNTLTTVRGGTRLLVGGKFHHVNGTARALFASLDPATGAVTGYLRVRVAGKLPHGGQSMVFNQQRSPSGKYLLFEGDFTRVGGQVRHQVAELHLGRQHATVNGFRNYGLNHGRCVLAAFYGRAAAFSPDEKTVYLATTGFRGTSPYCDAVIAFTNTAPARVRWVNKTGGDSLYAVAPTARTVYIGGHERWANNPHGVNSCGAGCVSRPGLGAIGARSGLATAWNPTRSRGHGADDLLLTRAGLWVASDTFFKSVTCAHRYHPGLCFLPAR